MARITDHFGRKRCQKKHKDVDYKDLKEFFQKYFVVHEQSAVENSFSKYVCYAPDGLFWLNLYGLCQLFFLNKKVAINACAMRISQKQKNITFAKKSDLKLRLQPRP